MGIVENRLKELNKKIALAEKKKAEKAKIDAALAKLAALRSKK